MPILLVDSNFLQTTKISMYLNGSHSNKIALSEHVMIEMHKTNPEIIVKLSCARIAQFPKQVLLLKSLPTCYGRSMRTGEQARSLIDYRQSKDFAAWYDDVLNVDSRPGIRRHLANRQTESLLEIEHLAATVHDLLPTFQLIKKRFTREEHKELRGRPLKTEATQQKLIDVIYDVSRALFKTAQVPTDQWPSTNRDAPHYYLWRYAACVTMLFIRWVEWGNLSQDTDKLVNHIIDMHIAAEATYFQGILTDDKTLDDVHRQIRLLLQMLRINAYVPHISSQLKWDQSVH